MEEIQVSSFEEFERKVEENISKIEKLSHTPLFRGQRNSSWKLETTLERRIKSSEYPFSEYFQKMKNVQKDIQISIKESRKWDINIPPFGDYNLNEIPEPEVYNFMIYLRHHGFPSPLLDWTSLKEVASFFAFQHPSDEKNVAVYVYFHHSPRGAAWLGRAKIITLGPNVIKPEIRHEKQASWYMLSIKTIEEQKIICNIEDAMKNERYLDEKFKKYLIPSKEKTKVLGKLEKSKINAITLFQDVDLLMERLKEKEFPLEEC